MKQFAVVLCILCSLALSGGCGSETVLEPQLLETYTGVNDSILGPFQIAVVDHYARDFEVRWRAWPSMSNVSSIVFSWSVHCRSVDNAPIDGSPYGVHEGSLIVQDRTLRWTSSEEYLIDVAARCAWEIQVWTRD